MSILSHIHSPRDIHSLSAAELNELASELRQVIIERVSKNGGHLASNLGVIELTLALARSFDFERESEIVFDVGHQAYAWKLITERQEAFHTLRQCGGLSGFPKRCESPYDFFDTGHASTSISAVLGLARAKRLQGRSGLVIAVTGDGAMGGGMAFEALNDAGPDDDVLVILNDNEMSIAPNVGALGKRLGEFRIKEDYQSFKRKWRPRLETHPLLLNRLRRFKSLDRLLYRRTGLLFESLNWRYYGPIDGHDIPTLERYLQALKRIPGPKILHIYTVKGRGYPYAEEKPETYHGVGHFEVEAGLKTSQGKAKTFSDLLGENALRAAKRDPRICAITAAMPGGTGLAEFASHYPERFFDVGIAEQHATCMAAALAAGGALPILALYSTFLQRSFDQLIHDIALQNLPVLLAVDRAGLVPADGETHQGLHDFALAANLPMLDVYAPRDERDVRAIFDSYLAKPRPILMRYPKGEALNLSFSTSARPHERPEECLRVQSEGKVTTLVWGTLCHEIAPILNDPGSRHLLGDLFSLAALPRSLDDEIIQSLRKTGHLICISETVQPLSFGAFIIQECAQNGLWPHFLDIAIPPALDCSGQRSELLQKSGLDTFNIQKKLLLYFESNLKC